MKKVLEVTLFHLLLSRGNSFAQPKGPPDPYKPILDRLESILALPLPEWRYHADVAHPEDSSLSDADWPTMKIHEEWKTGARVFRGSLEIPEKINGYAVRGSRVKLELL